jgi:hypothetical protein
MNTGISFSQSGFGTSLGRICEFDAANVKGLMDTGNFIITSELISYSIDTNGGRDVSYMYKIKKLTQTRNNTFGLSLRRRGMEGRGDYPVNTLNILLNGRRTQVSYVETSYDGHHYDEDGNRMPLDINWEDDPGVQMAQYFTAYKGWYYFNVDFLVSNEVEVEISYKTVLDDTGIQYDSHPFWLSVSNNAEIKVTVENNFNERFIRSITGCEPTDRLVSKNWNLEKPRQNMFVITYIPTWFSEKKGISIIFNYLYPKTTMPSSHFFTIIPRDSWMSRHYEEGIYLGSFDYSYGRSPENISLRLLGTYELIFLNGWQLRIIRNAFYARHRYRFKDNELNQLFYESTLNLYYNNELFNENFTEDIISPLERMNIEIIQNLENIG